MNKSDVTLEPKKNISNLEPFKKLLEEYRRAEEGLAEYANEVKAKFDLLVDRQRIAKRWADELEKVIQELES